MEFYYIYIIVAVCSATKVLPLNGDTAYFFGLADSLYRTGEYSFNYTEHTRFPPGFPVLILVWKLTGLPFQAFQSVLVLLSFTAVLLILAASFRVFGATIATISAVVFVSTPYSITMSSLSSGSDVPFFTCIAALVFIWSFLPSRFSSSQGIAIIFASFVIAASSCLTRSVGVVLIPAALTAICIEWFRMRRSSHILFLGSVLGGSSCASGAWWAWKHRASKSVLSSEFMQNYDSMLLFIDPKNPDLGYASLLDFVARFLNGFLRELTFFCSHLFGGIWILASWTNPLIVFLAIFVAIALCRLAVSSHHFLALLLLFYLTVIAVWPFDEAGRFLLPVFTLLLCCAAYGATLFIQIISGQSLTRLKNSAAALALLMTLLSFIQQRTDVQFYLFCVFWILLLTCTTAGLFLPAAKYLVSFLEIKRGGKWVPVDPWDSASNLLKGSADELMFASKLEEIANTIDLQTFELDQAKAKDAIFVSLDRSKQRIDSMVRALMGLR